MSDTAIRRKAVKILFAGVLRLSIVYATLFRIGRDGKE